MSLHVNNLTFAYNKKPVLHDISFQVEAGEFLGIIGPNGSGKSTLLRCLDGILAPHTGSIFIKDKSIQEMSRQELAVHIAYVPQKQLTVFSATVFDTILMGRKPHVAWVPSQTDIQQVAAIIKQLNLGEISMRNVNHLSGGQQQKAFIARALVQNTDILLLDEPTANLDLKHQLEVLDIIKTQTQVGTSVVMAIHDLNLALKYCDRIIMLKNGRIYAEGSKTIVTQENIEQVYGVKVSLVNHKSGLVIIPEMSMGDTVE